MMRCASVGVLMISSGLPRYSAINARSGIFNDSIKWVVKNPSCAMAAGVKDNSANLWAMRFKSATACPLFAMI